MPTATPPSKKTKINRLGLELPLYRGSKTTLCAGCGHNAISERVVDACFTMGVQPSQVVKLSGIGWLEKLRGRMAEAKLLKIDRKAPASPIRGKLMEMTDG